ncbi:ATP-grasp domain-containing protein [Parageobacillus thermoglucosidasius]|uniref:ATP-grasp domain-containing protein n=1 Tax=Parageobacillus thermoglucosidasius TaxID=1426 RepID=UPI000B57E1A8|nr:ATP-grasp domain-containing protein [Parageobacillus thermoglucosidasius]MBY6269482.1 hypothetical protein [Parageobacillus thermoglucosidasius]OUM83941.1 MAG: hypothetical protein BAA00_01770 [Parageobacillus thermoglucosidasius]
MSIKRVLMVGGYTQAIEYAKLAENIHLTFIQHKNRLRPQDLQIADVVHMMELNDNPDLEEFIRCLHRIRPFDAVLSVTEFSLLTASKMAEEFDLLNTPVKAVENTRDKYKMRQQMLASNCNPVRFSAVNNFEEIVRFFQSVGGPIILKPIDGTGSKGVRLIMDMSELEEQKSRNSILFPCLVEEYIDGVEFSVETITIDGRHTLLAITEKLTTGAPHFIEMGQLFRLVLATKKKQQYSKKCKNC